MSKWLIFIGLIAIALCTTMPVMVVSLDYDPLEFPAADAPSLLSVDVSGTVGVTYACKFSLADTPFDLTTLQRTTDWQGSTGDFLVKANVCAVSNVAQCSAKSGSACLWSKDGATYLTCLGRYDGSPVAEWSLINPANPSSGGIQLTAKNGDQVSMIRPTLIMKFPCDASTPSPVTMTATIDQGPNVATLTFPGRFGCKWQPAADASSSGLSGGSVFLIIVLVCTVVYIGAGCAYKHRVKGTRGMESCPNYDWWREIPSYTIAGCRYTRARITGAGRSDNYAKV